MSTVNYGTSAPWMIRVTVERATSFLKLGNDPTENLRLLAAKTNKKACSWRVFLGGQESEYVLKYNDADTMEMLGDWAKSMHVSLHLITAAQEEVSGEGIYISFIFEQISVTSNQYIYLFLIPFVIGLSCKTSYFR